MNTRSDSPADTRAPAVLVWDLPVRVFHWLMVASFAGAWITAESERWRLLHVTLGYTMAGLVVFRLLWGLFGSRTARFADFVRGPAAVARYLRSLLRGRPEHHTGHNPAGALAIVGLLALVLATAATGWATFEALGGRFEDLHEGAANALMALVMVHLVGVIVGSLVHHENLVRAMFSGRKPARPGEGIASARRGVAVLLLAGVAGFWWTQWQAAGPIDTGGSGHAAVSAVPQRHADADDD